MADDFDPYEKWLAIPPRDQPPNHYRLLGLRLGEDNPQVIADAAHWKAVIVGTCASGPHGDHVPRLLDQIEAARTCLLDQAARAAYDASLHIRPSFRPRTLFPGWLYRDVLLVGGGLLVPVLAAYLLVWLLNRERPAPDAAAQSRDAPSVQPPSEEAVPSRPTAPVAETSPASDSSRPLDIRPFVDLILGAKAEAEPSPGRTAEPVPGSESELDELLLSWRRKFLGDRRTSEPPEVTRARGVLAEAPQDPEARTSLGKYECFVEDDWGAGLRHLSSCSDAELVKLAALEASRPDTPAELLALADAWYAWGRKANEVERLDAYFRSLTWYRRASPRLSPADKRRLEPRITELTGALSDAQSNPSLTVPWLDHRSGDVRVLEGHAGTITALAVAPTGTLLASAAEDGTVRMWNWLSGEQVWKHETKTRSLTGLVITPDLKSVFSNFDDRQFVELQTLDGRVRRHLGGSPGPPLGLCLTRDGLLIWGARSPPSRLFVWDLGQNRWGGRLEFGDDVRALHLSPDGRRIATGDGQGKTRILDRRTGASEWEAAAQPGPIIAIDLSADGRHVATASEHEIRVWKIPAPEPLHSFPVETVRAIAFSPDGRRLACGAGEQILWWDVPTGRRHELPPAAAAAVGDPITCLAFLPDVHGLAAGTTGGKITLWRLAD